MREAFTRTCSALQAPWRYVGGRQSWHRAGGPTGLRSYPGRAVAGEGWQGLIVISLHGKPEAQISALDALRADFEAKGVAGKEVREATGFWWSMIPTAINSSFNYPGETASGEIVMHCNETF